MEDVASIVSALSVMLGAYGFFYNAYAPQLTAGEEVGGAAANRSAWAKQVRTVERARTTARVLAAVPLVVFLIFTPDIWDRLEALASGPDLGDYSTLDVVFMLLACSWLAIALIVARRAAGLGETLATLRRAAPPE